MSSWRWLRQLALALSATVLVLGVLTARMVVEGEAAMRASDAAFKQGNARDAARAARQAALLYAPGAPHVARAYARLCAVATGAEAAGDADLAEAAWRDVRGVALETRSFISPHARELERANQSLARLALRGATSPEEQKAALERARAELARDDAPRPPWVLALVLGFLAASAGLALVAWRGITPQGELRWQQAWPGAGLALAGLLLWAVAVADWA